MDTLDKLATLTDRFATHLTFYKSQHNAYNEYSCRVEYIDPLLQIFGWDVTNKKGLHPQYREVIAENYSTQTDRPDYSLTLRGVSKLFVEAKKPAIDIFRHIEPALQARKYGWNANHKVTVLTNFEYLIIYDTTVVPKVGDSCSVARYRYFHFAEYVEKFEEIHSLLSRDVVYSGAFDAYYDEHLSASSSQKQQVDKLFLEQINCWRVSLSNELYLKDAKYRSLDVLNDVVQDFINQIVFLRICEDKNLPLYHRLQDTISEPALLKTRLEEMLRAADRRYDSGLFSGDNIVFDLSSAVITDIVESLYYPQSPYMFSIIESNLLGKIYEMFLTEQLVVLEGDIIGLAKKVDYADRSIVTTPTEIVRYIVDQTMSKLCEGKTPRELLGLRIADIACGSGVFLEAAFDYLQNYCVEWYRRNDPLQLIEIGNGYFKLPLETKKQILCSCIYGIDIDIHAVEVAKFSLLVKLIENETTPSVVESSPILPELSTNLFHGNALIGKRELGSRELTHNELIAVVPFSWSEMRLDKQFDAIIGNPPYISTEDLHRLIPKVEFDVYKDTYMSAYKQFDKYFLFVERAICKVKDGGYVCYIVPNKFFKIDAGQKLRQLITQRSMLVQLDDFGDTQLFEEKTIYSSILLLQKHPNDEFVYSSVTSAPALWAGEVDESIVLKAASLDESPWKLTTDIDFMSLLQRLEGKTVTLETYATIFNGIQTSAERPTPAYWFAASEIKRENASTVTIERDGREFSIERSILKPFFKPTRKSEKGLNSYSILSTDKRIVFPYDKDGRLISKTEMENAYPGAYAFLSHYYDRLLPSVVSPAGVRDVPNATAETWYQYGRTQALRAFINTPKLIVGVLSQEPMYAYDGNNMLIASGGTAGYCAVSHKPGSPYALEYIQAWLSHPYTEKYIRMSGSYFEGGFVARGTYILSSLPFVELDFTNSAQKNIHDEVVSLTRDIYRINKKLASAPSKRLESVMQRYKKDRIKCIESLISRVYQLEF